MEVYNQGAGPGSLGGEETCGVRGTLVTDSREFLLKAGQGDKIRRVGGWAKLTQQDSCSNWILH